ncbi:MAG: hypothetical protein GY813_19410 [Halieaceae bacterium]|nr:hypothetical protein [Halieaceae bacterium]
MTQELPSGRESASVLAKSAEKKGRPVTPTVLCGGGEGTPTPEEHLPELFEAIAGGPRLPAKDEWGGGEPLFHSLPPDARTLQEGDGETLLKGQVAMNLPSPRLVQQKIENGKEE